jgi:NAD-dependent dihydropyrimidine dehydrogenase PreA subunit
MPFVIAEPCVDVLDRSCLDDCPLDCIYEGSRMLYINQDECLDCGMCEPVCPVEAIYFEADLPQDLVAYKAVNAEFVQVAPTASASAPAGVDHPFVRDLPPAGPA